MRFIIHELPYERPLLAGRLRYERDGVPTGALESWRLTSAADGYRFLRVDLDAREAPSGRSYLYHMTINPAGLPEQINYRLWSDGLDVSGTAVWEGNEVIAARQVNGVSYEDLARGSAFWFPAGVGLALLAVCVGETEGVTMVTDSSAHTEILAMVETSVDITLSNAENEQAGSEMLLVRPLTVAWGDQVRTVWLDGENRPMRVRRNDGLTATAERLVRYG